MVRAGSIGNTGIVPSAWFWIWGRGGSAAIAGIPATRCRGRGRGLTGASTFTGIWSTGLIGANAAGGNNSHSLSWLSLPFNVIPWFPGPWVGRGVKEAAYRGCSVSYKARRALPAIEHLSLRQMGPMVGLVGPWSKQKGVYGKIGEPVPFLFEVKKESGGERIERV